MICFYHRQDLDGWCSGAIVKYFYPDAILLEMDYGMQFPWALMKFEPNADRRVIMVDFAMKIPDMVRLAAMCDLIWVDHHITAIEAATKARFNPEGYRVSGVGACELTWKWCASQVYDKMSSFVPVGVKLLADYDVGKITPQVLQYEYGVRTNVTGPDHNLWKEIFEGYVYEDIMKTGKIVTQYVSRQFAKAINFAGFEGVFDGFPAFFLNTPLHDSLLCKPLESERVWEGVGHPPRLFVQFVWAKEQEWYVIVESTDSEIHCGRLCEKHGGGGHEQVGGFRSKDLSFLEQGNG